MDDLEQVVDFFEAIESGDWHALSEKVDDQFLFYGPFPDPVGKETWIDFQRAVLSAFPDWAYNIEKVEKIGTSFEITVHITGTHLNELALPIKGFDSIPASKIKIEMPVEHALLKVRNGKVIEMRVEQQLHGNLPGLLEQLGVE